MFNIRSLLAAIAILCLAATRAGAQCDDCTCPGDRPLTAADLPTIDVRIERVETARYPNVDIYFRVVDTNPTTVYHQIVPDDVKLEDGPAGGAFAPAAIVSQNFANPDLRALAASVVLDRSLSVDSVLPFIRQAIVSFIGLMKPASANTYRFDTSSPALPDVTEAFGLAGDRFLRGTYAHSYSADRAELADWVTRSFVDTACCSPIFSCLDKGIQDTSQQSYDLPDGSRLVFLISDGQENCGYPVAPGDFKPNIAIANARAAGIRCYAMGMVFVNNQGVVPNNICRNWMKEVANQTGGSYFEPISPFPVVPGAPQPPTGANIDDPVALDDAVALAYLQVGLGTAANMAKTQNKFGPLATNLKDILNVVMTAPPPAPGAPSPTPSASASPTTTPAPPPTSYEQFIPAWTAPTFPTMPGVPAVTYRMLANLQQVVTDFSAVDVTQQDLQKADYYNDQVRNVLTKIQASEKNIYKVTTRVDNAPFDGSLRTVKLTVQYHSSVNGVVKQLPATSATSGYKAPTVADEDRAQTATFPIDMTVPAAATALNVKDPRGGPWSGPLQVNFETHLVTEVPGKDGAPPTAVVVATTNGPNGYKELDPPATLPNIADVQRHINAEKADYQSLLTSVAAAGTYVPGSGAAPPSLRLDLAPKTPMCVANLDDPTARPVANASDPDHPRLQWYEMVGVLTRPYQYVTTDLGSVTPKVVNAVAKFQLPTFVYYVADRTAPSLGIYMTPAGSSTNMVTVHPDTPDQDPSVTANTSKTFVLGDALGAPGGLHTLQNGFDVAPYKFEPNGSTPGFVVPMNIPVRVQVLAKDNMDHDTNHAYLGATAAADKIPLSDRWTLDTANESAAKDNAIPYLDRVNWGELGTRSGANYRSGVSYEFLESGVAGDPLATNKIFRAANVTVVGDSFTVNAGQEIFLHVQAYDAAGHKTETSVPILVTGMGVNIDKLTYENRKK